MSARLCSDLEDKMGFGKIYFQFQKCEVVINRPPIVSLAVSGKYPDDEATRKKAMEYLLLTYNDFAIECYMKVSSKQHAPFPKLCDVNSLS